MKQPTLAEYVLAAKVFSFCFGSGTGEWPPDDKPIAEAIGLLDYWKSLSVIHRADASDWPALVAAMLRGEWSKETTEARVEAVKQFTVPDNLSNIYPRAEVIRRYLSTLEFAPTTLAKLIEAVRQVEQFIAAHSHVIDSASYLTQFHAWLIIDRNAWDGRRIAKRLRELYAECETADMELNRRWNHCDWREAVNDLAEKSVALVLTDPPYGIDFQSDFRLDRTKAHRHAEIQQDDDGPVAATEIQACLRALQPKLTENAHVLCFCHWSQEPIMRQAIECAGYTVRGSLIWAKNNTGMGDPNTTFAPKHERIIHAVKGSPILFRREPDVLEAARVESDRHPTEKPVALLQRLIEATTVEGELVADPFGGVASTLVAAKKAERNYWGCEIDAEYHAAGGARLTRER